MLHLQIRLLTVSILITSRFLTSLNVTKFPIKKSRSSSEYRDFLCFIAEIILILKFLDIFAAKLDIVLTPKSKL